MSVFLGQSQPTAWLCAASPPNMPGMKIIRAEIIGGERGEAEGHSVCANAPVLAMCRAPVAAGFDPATTLETYRGHALLDGPHHRRGMAAWLVTLPLIRGSLTRTRRGAVSGRDDCCYRRGRSAVGACLRKAGAMRGHVSQT